MSNEADLMPYVDSCSIACGGHYGDFKSMTQTLELAKKFGITVGAHPSYLDRTNFGRKIVEVSHSELKRQIREQISVLDKRARSKGMVLHHVKAHGALYNEAARNEDVANVLIDSVVSFEKELCIFVPYGSNLHQLSVQRGLNHFVEVFADRNYDERYELLSRRISKAIILEPSAVVNRVKKMVQRKCITIEDGRELPIEFDTICVDGDHPNALEILRGLHALKRALF